MLDSSRTASRTEQHGVFELYLFSGQGLFASLDFGVGQLFDFFQHLLRAGAVRQLGDDQLPLATRQVFDLPAGAHLQAAAAGAVGLLDVLLGGDDLPTTGEVRPLNDLEQLLIRQLVVLDQGHAGRGHFAQVVAGDLGGQAHGNAAGTVEQRKRQTRRQLRGLFGRAVVVGHEVDRAHVDFIEQQARDRCQAGFRVPHGRSAIAIARAEVALPVDQRVAQRKVLRHAHHGVIGGRVTVRVIAAQHIAHHARALDRLGAIGAAETQAHALHRVQDAALNRLLAVAHIGQGPALDHAQGVFQVGTLGVMGQGQGVTTVRRRRRSEVNGLLGHLRKSRFRSADTEFSG